MDFLQGVEVRSPGLSLEAQFTDLANKVRPGLNPDARSTKTFNSPSIYKVFTKVYLKEELVLYAQHKTSQMEDFHVRVEEQQ
ncbi:hypothetical protein ACP4OV_021865 [Aristida adscensionis]